MCIFWVGHPTNQNLHSRTTPFGVVLYLSRPSAAWPSETSRFRARVWSGPVPDASPLPHTTSYTPARGTKQPAAITPRHADGAPGMDEAKFSLHSATRSSGGTRSSSAIVPSVHTAVGTTTSTRSGHGHVMPSTRLDDGRRMLQDDDAMVTERLSCQTSTGTFDTYRRHARCAVAGTETGSERIGTLRR